MKSHWIGIYGTNYFLQIKSSKYKHDEYRRIMFDYYCKDEHFYYLWWYSSHDIIFASYDLNEIIRFAKKLITTKMWMRDLYVEDVVTKQRYAFISDDERNNWFLKNGYKAISLGKHEFINEKDTNE